MKKTLSILSIIALALSLGACTMTSSVNLKAVADASKMKNITTSDGEFPDYKAIGEFKGREIGFGIGFPFIKIFEIFPGKSNEALLTEVAQDASKAGADAMIDVDPASESFGGFIIGLYFDSCKGTGIKLK